jgi:hypothetical protein
MFFKKRNDSDESNLEALRSPTVEYRATFPQLQNVNAPNEAQPMRKSKSHRFFFECKYDDLLILWRELH